MKQLFLLNPENASTEEAATWGVRYAARAVVVDDQGNTALLHVRKHGYYKLPGGGVDEGENILAALARECLEEIGCTVKVRQALGLVEEYRKMFSLRQVSHCYLAQVVGPKAAPEFTESEKENDFALVWVSLAEARQLLTTCQPDNQEGRSYIVPRDTLILAEALAVFSEG